jgi:hypothetical protein
VSHHDQDPGHGEPGHVHDEHWNRHMMETDDPPQREPGDEVERDADQTRPRIQRQPDPTDTVIYDR